MGFLDELKRLARPYEDEEEEEEFDDFEPVSRSERMDRTGGDRLERKAPKAQDSTGPIFPVENERRSNKVVNIHTTTQLQVVLVKPERFENASEIADHLREKRTVVLNLESTKRISPAACWISSPVWPMPMRAKSKRWPSLLILLRPTTWIF